MYKPNPQPQAVATLLVERKASVDPRDLEGSTPLLLAVQVEHVIIAWHDPTPAVVGL